MNDYERFDPNAVMQDGLKNSLTKIRAVISEMSKFFDEDHVWIVYAKRRERWLEQSLASTFVESIHKIEREHEDRMSSYYKALKKDSEGGRE